MKPQCKQSRCVKSDTDVRDHDEHYYSEERRRSLAVLGFSPNSLWKLLQPHLPPRVGERGDGATGCDLPVPPCYPLWAKPRWVEKPHQPTDTELRASPACPPRPLPPSFLFPQHFSPPTELQAGARGPGPWCSGAWLVPCRLLIRVAWQSPTEAASSLRGVAGTLAHGNGTSLCQGVASGEPGAGSCRAHPTARRRRLQEGIP